MRFYLIPVVLLAACSSGGGAAPISEDPIDELPTVIEPEPDPVPTGTATYRGPISMGFTPQDMTRVELDGTLALAVDFDASNDAVTGDASGFRTASGGTVDGRLFLSGGSLDDRGPTLQMNSQISGSLRNNDIGYLVFGQLNGAFENTHQSNIAGTVSGTVRQSGLDTNLVGDFLSARVP